MQHFIQSFVWIGILCSTLCLRASAQSGKVDAATVEDCTLFTDFPDAYLPEQGTSCASIAAFWDITVQTFIIWNPAVKADCSNLVEGNSYCVEENYRTEPSNPNPPQVATSSVSRAAPIATSSASSTRTSSAAPSPTQSGLTRECLQFYFVQSGDTCVDITNTRGTFTLASFYEWNPAVGSNCQGLQAGVYVCVGVRGTPTSPASRTTTAMMSAKPTATQSDFQPRQPNVSKDCRAFHRVVEGDTCEVIVNRYRTFTTQQFISWNPDVGTACTGLWLDYYMCIGVSGSTSTSTTTRISSSPTAIATPTPIQSGTISTCNRFVKSSASGASCSKFSGGNRMSLGQLYAWNRVLGVRGENCASQFSNSMNYCVAVTGPLKPPNNGPAQPGVIDTCWRYGDAIAGGTCQKFADRFGISLSQLYAWNPVLGSSGQNCQSNFWAGYWYCVQVAG